MIPHVAVSAIYQWLAVKPAPQYILAEPDTRVLASANENIDNDITISQVQPLETQAAFEVAFEYEINDKGTRSTSGPNSIGARGDTLIGRGNQA
jgi:hypothetical protein